MVSLEERKKIHEAAFKKGWNEAMNSQEVKSALNKTKHRRPKNIRKTHSMFYIYTGRCPGCNFKIDCMIKRSPLTKKIVQAEYSYCPQCGQGLSWGK